MKMPRDMDAAQLIKALQRVGYRVVRRSGSHIRLQCDEPPHSVTIPNHSPLRIGTLSAILGDVASKMGTTREALLKVLLS
ncbi:MAG: type II toxin-antitoxin system HicA family toxin [Xanthomonadaceae bacterium]|nr:type II toxin-antitoxin system HicA family toxin [Xanthomonadaceae bacterium]MDE1885639.1 type II toxin-antitoxin system HicA family toxin [Xanthomonadaceae bacterium]MDE1961625.1 type II toxin-antitoxin system HicA family toxin [Xanthomonadaceae bacterium]MDE2083667.1 type II toxin-antitoxin system HicA family toxin [Xanthomonadaceae bacterium]